MSDWKGIVKKGWHPEKEGTGLRDQVKGLIGRGDNSSPPSGERSAPPISSLRDPYSFGPPPKHVGYHGSAAGAGVQNAGSVTQPPAGQTSGVQQQQLEGPAVEPKPYRLNTTGLSTSHLPPPPARRGSPDKNAAPPPYSLVKPSGGPPSLPPRLPPRSGNASPAQTQSPVSTGSSQPNNLLNQGAVSRLGAAGISVPGFGIGKTPAAPPTRAPTTTSSAGGLSTKPSSGQINELQGRFSRLGKDTSQQESTPPPPTHGSTWAEKQAALKTASSFRRDPSSVSFADAKAAAGTAHNFQQRHGDQVASGLRTANGLGQRFGVNERAFGGGVGGEQQNNGQVASTSPMGQISGIIGKKKPAPPPPAKKPQLSGAATDGSAPPPVPLGTRPRF
ncbi:hypothetical protein F4819DRAFT_464457 [Hypoxylon fuscum]|nr:hypothetical protein F4819DRAFT_464457 [Hypoxylon fuscum]